MYSPWWEVFLKHDNPVNTARNASREPCCQVCIIDRQPKTGPFLTIDPESFGAVRHRPGEGACHLEEYVVMRDPFTLQISLSVRWATLYFVLMQPPMTRNLILDFLRRARKPVPVEEVIDYVLSVKSYPGLTPRKTISSIISRSSHIVRKDGLCSLARGNNH